MKIVFFGTPDYVLPILKELNSRYEIAAVVTQEPKPTGRKKIIIRSPVDNWAYKQSLRSKDLKQRKIPVIYDLKKVPKFDLGVLAAYGKIIPKSAIFNSKFGILNIHPSLLPKYRGASPVQATILAGDTETGVTIIKIDELLDHGPIVSQFRQEVAPNDTLGTLRAKLFERASEVLLALIEPYLQGKVSLREQNHQEATHTFMVKKEHGFIPPKYLEAALAGKSLEEAWFIPFIKDYSLLPSAYSLERFIRAMDPWPGAWTLLRLSASEGQAKRLKILKAHLEGEKLVLDEVQLEGKNPVPYKQFSQAYPEAKFS